MKNLSFYIETLLYKHACVIIPQFGAFITNRKAAEITDDNLFLPPQKQISFNGSLTQNDGLLLNFISNEENISYQEAQIWIEKTIANWWEILQNEKTLSLENIGFFTLEENKILVFEPTTTKNYLTDAFGMEAISIKKSQKNELTPVTITLPKEDKTSEKSVSLLKYAAIILVGLSVISYGLYPYWKPIFSEKIGVKLAVSTAKKTDNLQTASVFNSLKKQEIQEEKKSDITKKEEKIQQEEKTINTEEKSEQKITEKVSEEVKSQTPPPVKIVENTPKIHLIAGAFSTEENAQTMLKQLNAQGFTSASMVGKNARGLFLVAYGSFQTETESLKLKQELKTKNLDTWVLKK